MNGDLTYGLITFGPFHVGSGIGVPGQLDDQVVCDERRFALIPGSHLRGLVRESCYQLAEYRDAHAAICSGQWRLRAGEAVGPEEFCAGQERSACVVCHLFGAPSRPGRLWFSDATYSEEYRAEVESFGPELALRDRHTSAHATIDRGTRRARENQLFNLEVVETTQHFAGAVDFMGGSQDAARGERELLGWLVAALLMTRRLGGRRRRGRGRCRIVIDTLPCLPGVPPAPLAVDELVRDWLRYTRRTQP